MDAPVLQNPRHLHQGSRRGLEEAIFRSEGRLKGTPVDGKALIPGTAISGAQREQAGGGPAGPGQRGARERGDKQR